VEFAQYVGHALHEYAVDGVVLEEIPSHNEVLCAVFVPYSYDAFCGCQAYIAHLLSAGAHMHGSHSYLPIRSV
jgi:hypothetical protein